MVLDMSVPVRTVQAYDLPFTSCCFLKCLAPISALPLLRCRLHVYSILPYLTSATVTPFVTVALLLFGLFAVLWPVRLFDRYALTQGLCHYTNTH
jgi:hypothetical protein